jgi:putative Mg2+ transporter-C (MgtC) family protein
VPSQLESVGLVALAGLFGSIIGFERESEQKPAGMRTHLLVAAAACLVVLLGRYADGEFDGSADPARALHGVVTGIGFLCAGTIMRFDNERVRGLTTAASLFFVAAVGIAVGLEKVVLAGGTTVLALITLWLPLRLRRGRGGSTAGTGGSEDTG